MKQFFMVLLTFVALLGANTTISGGSLEDGVLASKEHHLAMLQQHFSTAMVMAEKNLLVVRIAGVTSFTKMETPEP